MLDGLTPDLTSRLVLAIGGVGIALVLLVLVLIFLKRRNSPLFIKGGKSREPRLMVLDAAAVDPKRRLVLIRRDNVEHLIMIGGPTDIVIESGIADRTAVAQSSAAADEIAIPRPAAIPAIETRAAAPAVERRPEPVARPVTPPQPERPVAVETRAAAPAVQPATASAPQAVARPVPAQVNPAERAAPSADRYMERPAAERQPEIRNVSAMGSVLYGEDREPMTGGKTAQPVADPRVAAPAPRRVDPEIQPVPAAARPLPSAAEAALDAARDRVLPNQTQPISANPTVTAGDAERVLAARMEAMRRVQSAQPAVSSNASPALAQPATQPVIQRSEPQVEAPKVRDAEPSDFEKLLEAELDASGIFGKQTPDMRGEGRVTNAVAAPSVAPPVRVTPPITGATANVTSEEEVARLLGEIAVNRKP